MTFTATLMKGRSNYLCLHRFQAMDGTYESRGMFDAGRGASITGAASESEKSIFLPVIRDWAARTDTGDRAELADLPEDLALWNHISATADTCLGAECPQFTDCFVTRMRQRAGESDVVIVNHHLLCADASVRKGSFGEVIPSCTSLVVDEAHQLEDVATQYFGLAFSNYRFDDFVRDADRSLTAARAALEAEAGDTAWEPRQIESAARTLTRMGDHGRHFFQRLADAREAASPAAESRVRYTAETIADYLEDGAALAGAIEGFEATIALMLHGLDSSPIAPADGSSETLQTIQRRAGELHRDLRLLLRGDDPDLVYFLETRGRGIFLRAAPVDVSRLVREALFDRFRSVVLTSATLAVDGCVRLRQGPARTARSRRDPRAGRVRLRLAGAALPAAADAAAQVAGIRGGGGGGGDRHPAAHARAGVRALHQLRGAAGGPAGARGDAALSRCWCRGRRPGRRCCRCSGPRRTPCCWRPPASGRAWTSWARR